MGAVEYVQRGRRLLLNIWQGNRRALASVAVCSVLVCVGLIRLLSYSQGAVGEFVRRSALDFLCYNPASRFNVQFFKVLATPTVVALIYFCFRWRNAGAPSYPNAPALSRFNRIDFKSPKLRGLLTSLITLHWLVMEWWKFNVEGFYPWSELEGRWLNIGVLIVSQALAFWGMKYLSFEPLSGGGTHSG